ncbi:hypothetical protein BBU64B_J0006 (plasmid) [Borreliella burgdorferi 64b]|nr:hypothetical protein BBU64B_J0006 [Borreliella burgdorferi 64b]
MINFLLLCFYNWIQSNKIIRAKSLFFDFKFSCVAWQLLI